MDLTIEKRKSDFYNQLDLSKLTISNYRTALNSTFLKEMCIKELGVEQVFEITDIKLLWAFYSKINLHPYNMGKHRIYSAAIMRYLRFVNNGKKYGRRIDFNQHRKNPRE